MMAAVKSSEMEEQFEGRELIPRVKDAVAPMEPNRVHVAVARKTCRRPMHLHRMPVRAIELGNDVAVLYKTRRQGGDQ